MDILANSLGCRRIGPSMIQRWEPLIGLKPNTVHNRRNTTMQSNAVKDQCSRQFL